MRDIVDNLIETNEFKEVKEGYKTLKNRFIKESNDKWKVKVEGFIDNLISTVADCYIHSLECGCPLNVTLFCERFDMSEEDIGNVHKVIKEKLMKMKIDNLQEDFT